jgi:class 3 adenylate cyclase
MEKIKTMGDRYMAVCGVSVPYLDHEKRSIEFAIEMRSIIRRFNHERDFHLNIRISQCATGRLSIGRGVGF